MQTARQGYEARYWLERDKYISLCSTQMPHRTIRAAMRDGRAIIRKMAISSSDKRLMLDGMKVERLPSERDFESCAEKVEIEEDEIADAFK